MKGDGVLNLLIFQAFQDVRMASSLVRSTIQTLGIPRVFAFFGVVGFGRMPKIPSVHFTGYSLRYASNYRFKGLKKSSNGIYPLK